MALQLRELHHGDGCRSLKLGDPSLTPLKTYLAKDAKRFHKQNLAKTFVLVEEGEVSVKGYVTILCTHVRVVQMTEPLDVEGGFTYKDYPAVKLARLAVSSGIQKQGAGGYLVDFVVGLAAEEIMPRVGCRFLVLDAKPNSVGFYEKKGFSKMGPVEDGNETLTAMFIDLHKLGSYGSA